MDPAASPDARFAPVATSKTFNRILSRYGLRDKKVLDMGCGYGEYLVRFGSGSVGMTTNPAEVAYGRGRGLMIVQGNVERLDDLPPEKFEAFWANNLFEHLLSPHAFLIKLKSVATGNAVLVLGVPVVPRIATLMRGRKFRGALAIAHINFFTRETLRLTVERAGWKVEQVRPFVFSNRLLDFLCSFVAPHLYVVAKNNPDFRYADKKLKEWQDDAHYADMLQIVNGISPSGR